MKWICRIWTFLDQFSGVATTLGWVFVGVLTAYKWLKVVAPKGHWTGLVTSIFLIFIALTLRFFWLQIQKLYLRYKSNLRSTQIADDLRVLKDKSALNPSLLILPSTKQLERWWKFSKEIAHEWSDDAKEEHMSVSIDKSNNTYGITPQICFFSPWKSQELVIFPNMKSSKIMREITTANYSTHSPFFVRYKNWDLSVQKAYQKTAHLLGNSFSLGMYSHYDEFHFEFSYSPGGVEKRIIFDFNGVKLRSQDGSEVNIVKKKSH